MDADCQSLPVALVESEYDANLGSGWVWPP